MVQIETRNLWRAAETASVVHVNNSQETFTASASGAIATHIWEVCRAGRQKGAVPVVITQDAPEPPLPDVPCLWISSPRTNHSRVGYWAKRVRKKICGWRDMAQPSHASRVIQCIHRHGLHDRKMVFHNDPELAACVKKRFPRSRIIVHFHNPVPCAARFASFLAESDVAFCAVSGYVAAEVGRVYRKPCDRVALNGVDARAFYPAQSRSGEVPEICFLGRTGIEKGADLLLKAALILAGEGCRFRLRLIGSNHWGRWERDPYQDELQRLWTELEERGVTGVRTGHLPRSQIAENLRQADIFVLPSRWQEPCALSLLEGMASGLAVVASRTGGTPSVLAGAGLLFEAEDVEGLAIELRRLLRDPGLGRQLGIRARMRACALSWETTWDALMSVGVAGAEAPGGGSACDYGVGVLAGA